MFERPSEELVECETKWLEGRSEMLRTNAAAVSGIC
jgi:hypothetical protein